jgi:hypothetical protein
MFEVVELAAIPGRTGFFSRQARHRPVKLVAKAKMSCQKLGRSFEGHGQYSVQTYQGDFSEGETISILVDISTLIAVGDLLSMESLLATGSLDGYLRLVATSNQ